MLRYLTDRLQIWLAGERIYRVRSVERDSYEQTQAAILRAAGVSDGDCIDYTSGRPRVMDVEEAEAVLNQYDQERTR